MVQNEKEIMALFPLGIRKTWGISVLEWLGGQHADYMGPLLGNNWENMASNFPQYWQKTLDKLLPFDVIHFQKQLGKTGGIDNSFLSIMKNRKHLYSYQSKLEGNWDDYYVKKTNSKTRQTDRRKLRKLNKIGTVTIEFAENEEIKYKIIKKMIKQKRRRYRDTGVLDMLSVPEHKEFYKMLADITDDTLKIHCAALYVGETIVATHVGLVDQSIFYYLMPAHEGGKWERYSPGRLLLEHLLEWSIQNKLKVFDFTIGGEHYKKDWCDTETPLYETFEAITAKGKLYVMAQHTKQTIKGIPWLGEQARQLNHWFRNIGVLPNNS